MNFIINMYGFSAHTFVSMSTALAFVLYDHPQQNLNRECRIYIYIAYFPPTSALLCLYMTSTNMTWTCSAINRNYIPESSRTRMTRLARKAWYCRIVSITRRKICSPGRVQYTTPPFIYIEHSASRLPHGGGGEKHHS